MMSYSPLSSGQGADQRPSKLTPSTSQRTLSQRAQTSGKAARHQAQLSHFWHAL